MKMRIALAALCAVMTFVGVIAAQQDEPRQQVRTVTIPISIFTKKELRQSQPEEFVQLDRLIVHEDNQEQQIVSIRSVNTTALSIAIVIQDDLTSSFNLQLRDIRDFIEGLPPGTRVMTAYSRSGTIEVRQRFTDDLTLAAKSLRAVSGSPTMGPRSPFDGVQEVSSRFDAVPAGRRAILLFSDGLDSSEGLNLASIAQSLSLQQAILKAQRRSIAVYSFYGPTRLTESGKSIFVLAAQGALAKLSDETGGRAFFQGSTAPVSYLPFFSELVMALNRQFALTYVSTHMKKGYHKVRVTSTNPEIKIEHPRGYYYR